MDILKLFKEKEALLEGHFLLSSGLHSNKYIQCALVLQYPDITEKIADALIMKLLDTIGDKISSVTYILSPAIGGIVIGQEIARLLTRKFNRTVKSIFTERENGLMVLRRGFKISDSDKVIIVEDVITTGGTTKELVELVKNFNAELISCLCIIDRSKNINLGYPLTSLEKINIDTYQSENCPLCKQNIPLIKPGSRKMIR